MPNKRGIVTRMYSFLWFGWNSKLCLNKKLNVKLNVKLNTKLNVKLNVEWNKTTGSSLS